MFLRILVLFLFLSLLAFALTTSREYLALGAGILSFFSFLDLQKYLIRRFREIDDFFESVKYRDFSRKFVEELGPKDIRHLHKGFNEVNKVVREINMKKEVQYLYLQKILEMVDIGLIAYNMETGDVLWANESIKHTLDLPSFKNISFVVKRKPELFQEVFETYHPKESSVSITVKNEKLKVLISDTIFQMQKESFKLIVLQNIDDTLDRNESEAWKKLLSVMTHEIMNSIAPISSLAETLHTQVKLSVSDPGGDHLDPEDLDAGLRSIKKRSEGLMKFAKTYRSLNKITHLNLETVKVQELFQNIQHLMEPSLKDKHVEIQFVLEPIELEVEIDTYLIEQVLINLILNAVDACSRLPNANIIISARKDIDRNTNIRIQDNGSGIPEEILDSIFIPFFTTKKNGSGIGLSLCKQIIMLHRGKILIHSKQGVGTVVNLIF